MAVSNKKKKRLEKKKTKSKIDELNDIKIFENKIKDFCGILLSKMDVADLNSLKKELEFFREQETYKVIINDYNINYFKSNIEQMHNMIESYCFSFIYQKSLNAELYTPYSFYEHDSMLMYATKLDDLFFDNYKVNIPEYFQFILTWISNKAEEFKIFADYTQNKIYFNNKRNADEIQQQTNQINENINKLEKNVESAAKDISDYQTNVIKLRKTIKSVKNIADVISEKINKVEDDSKDRLHNTEKNMIQTSISILGVFAAVVLTFNMGISFAAEALQVFMESSIYHSVLVILLFGFIIGNVIFSLFAFLIHIYNKAATKEVFNDTILGKTIKLFNIVLAVLFALNIVCWMFGAAEYRNEIISSKYTSEQITHEQTTAENTASEDNDNDKGALK